MKLQFGYRDGRSIFPEELLMGIDPFFPSVKGGVNFIIGNSGRKRGLKNDLGIDDKRRHPKKKIHEKRSDHPNLPF